MKIGMEKCTSPRPIDWPLSIPAFMLFECLRKHPAPIYRVLSPPAENCLENSCHINNEHVAFQFGQKESQWVKPTDGYQSSLPSRSGKPSDLTINFLDRFLVLRGTPCQFSQGTKSTNQTPQAANKRSDH